MQVQRPQLSCWLTHTTPHTHRLIQDNLAETPVYGGWLDSKGPRYCPSIEDKIVRFADKDSHQARIFPDRSSSTSHADNIVMGSEVMVHEACLA